MLIMHGLRRPYLHSKTVCGAGEAHRPRAKLSGEPLGARQRRSSTVVVIGGGSVSGSADAGASEENGEEEQGKESHPLYG
jgi:hypothetical protein